MIYLSFDGNSINIKQLTNLQKYSIFFLSEYSFN